MALDREKLTSVAKGAGLAALGAGLAYLIPLITSGHLDLGSYGPLVGGLLSVVANAIRKSLEQSPPEPPAPTLPYARLPPDHH